MLEFWQSDPRAAQIRDLLDQLACNGAGATHVPSRDDFDQVLANAKTVAAELTELRMHAARAKECLNELTQVIVALVSFDYTRRAFVSDTDDMFDGLAVGLNLLAEELSSSRAYVNNILESMTDVLVVLDPQGLMKSLNQAACALTLHSKEELIGQSVTLLFEDVAGPDLIRRGGVTDQEMTCRTKGGHRIPVSFSASIMRDVREQIQGVVCVARDLTESKRVEAERLRLRDVLTRQTILVEELSTPIIPVADEILVLPLIGSLDEDRSARMTQALLRSVVNMHARVAILDITGVPTINAGSVHGVLRAVQAARMIGAQVLLTGIRPAVARTLVELDADLGGMMTFGTLRDGVAYAMRHITGRGLRV